MNREHRRILRIVGFMEGKGIPYQCSCGQTHKIELSAFEERNGELKPRNLIQLQCSSFYDALQNIDNICADINVQMSPDAGFIRRGLARLYVWLLLKWLNH